MPLAAAAPSRLPAPGAEMTGDLAPDWPEPQDASLADWDPGYADLADWDPGDADLLADWDPEDPAVERPEAGGREVLKAGRWDRSCGDGGGFAAGGVADRLLPGPVLAGFAADAWARGLGRLSDDELVGVMRAGRRQASWAAAMELAAVGELWRRRVAEEEAGDTGAAYYAGEEIAAALTLTARAADQELNLAIALGRLPLTSQALAAGDIDLPRATVIAREVTGLDDEHAAGVDRAIASSAPGKTTGQLAAATRHAVMAADPGAARRRKEHAQRDARVERWAEHAGTAALAGRDLPPTSVLAADQNLTALARQLKAAGVPGTACDHAWQTGAYQPSAALRHLVETRHGTCVFPGCRRPAAQCDQDHTVPYDQGGKTCLCNLAPLCRRHHRTKQARGWQLKQVSPGVLAWSTPSGRHYVA